MNALPNYFRRESRSVVLVDAGPLIALIDRSDRHHRTCHDTLKKVTEPLTTVWPVLTEAMYLVGTARAQQVLWAMIGTGGVRLIELAGEDCPRMRELMWKYRDLPMDLADAALVRVAERENVRRIFTIDRKDFQVYRPQRVGRFEIVP